MNKIKQKGVASHKNSPKFPRLGVFFFFCVCFFLVSGEKEILILFFCIKDGSVFLTTFLLFLNNILS